MKRDVVVIGGLRTPYSKANGAFSQWNAVDLGTMLLRELLANHALSSSDIDQVILGNVIQPAHATNISRVIALSAGLAHEIPAHTVQRNCASGLQAITDAAEKIQMGRCDVVVAGGVESMTHAPLMVDDSIAKTMLAWSKAKDWSQKLKALRQLSLASFKPKSTLLQGLHDCTVGLNMGQTAEILARDFNITRQAQDEFALLSHQRAAQAWQDGWFDDEVMPLFPPPTRQMTQQDEGVRPQQNKEALQKLRPVFSRPLGSVTAGNSSQISDGATMLILSDAEKAKDMGWPIMGFLHDWHYSGCDPSRMGLGPVFASDPLLSKYQLRFSDLNHVEINEAFSAQVLAVLEAMGSDRFSQEHFGHDSLGVPDPSQLNRYGGAIAMGHPVGASGARLVLSVLRQLQKTSGLGLASLCIGGGQGGAILMGSEACKRYR
ncbi:MAG: thiolase family protein [Mariprofundaceae bacterium]|nr:thiolase family protein [Mariprofundaceae bacterium]